MSSKQLAVPAAVLLAFAVLAAPTTARKKVSFTETITGATISGTETDSVQAYRISGSRGPGAGFSIGKVDTTKTPAEIKSRNTNYYANGVERTSDIATLSQNPDGTLKLTGKGTCLAGGTGVFKGKSCSYTYTGTYDPETTRFTLKVKGTSSG